MKIVYCMILSGRLTGRIFRRARRLDDAHYLWLVMPVSIEQSPYWQTTSSSDAREIFRLLFFFTQRFVTVFDKGSFVLTSAPDFCSLPVLSGMPILSGILRLVCSEPRTFSVKLRDFTVWRHIWRKNWVNCAVLTGNSAGLRNVLSSRLSHTELRSSLRQSHSFLSLPADPTMASSQGNSFSRWASHDIFLFKYHFLLRILRFLFFFSDNIMADVASKQQTTAFFYPPYSHAQEDTHNWPKNWQTWCGNLCCAREHSVQFFVQFLYTVKLDSLTLECMGLSTLCLLCGVKNAYYTKEIKMI
jgi:hypothetical protein